MLLIFVSLQLNEATGYEADTEDEVSDSDDGDDDGDGDGDEVEGDNYGDDQLRRHPHPHHPHKKNHQNHFLWRRAEAAHRRNRAEYFLRQKVAKLKADASLLSRKIDSYADSANSANSGAGAGGNSGQHCSGCSCGTNSAGTILGNFNIDLGEWHEEGAKMAASDDSDD